MIKRQAGETMPVVITINGHPYRRIVEPRLLLSDFLRDTVGLTGTHVGCEHGVCGACTVVVDGLAVRSCLRLAVSCDGSRVLTVEGIARHPEFARIQAAFEQHHGLQCGFCTPGILASAVAEVVHRDCTPQAIEEILAGHLCRCTGYVGIRRALLALGGGPS